MSQSRKDADVDTNLKALDVGNLSSSGPSCWGPPQWIALHQLLRGYPLENAPQEKQDALKAYVTGLAGIIPCNACAQHWKVLAETVQTSDRRAALAWSIDAHNLVNARLGKRVLTYMEAARVLTDQCPNNKYSCAGSEYDGVPGRVPASSSVAALSAATDTMYGLSVVTVVVMLLAITAVLLSVALIVRKRR
jgi:hypothetical protein